MPPTTIPANASPPPAAAGATPTPTPTQTPKPTPTPTRPGFLVLWTLAIAAAVCAFVLHLALHARTVELGYKVGAARAEQARLREVSRVLRVEAASYKTPERVEIVARTLLGMEPPPPDRIVPMPAISERALDKREADKPSNELARDERARDQEPTPP